MKKYYRIFEVNNNYNNSQFNRSLAPEITAKTKPYSSDPVVPDFEVFEDAEKYVFSLSGIEMLIILPVYY